MSQPSEQCRTCKHWEHSKYVHFGSGLEVEVGRWGECDRDSQEGSKFYVEVGTLETHEEFRCPHYTHDPRKK